MQHQGQIADNKAYPVDKTEVCTPCYVVDIAALRHNLEILADVRERTGCRILLALKAFALYRVAPLINRYLDGTCATSVHEARLGREEFGGEVHACAAAYSDQELDELLRLCNHISFNSFSQWHRFKARVAASDRTVSCGLRINPRQSEAPVPLYDPCSPGSRLGIVRETFEGEDLEGISGLHFHTLCQQNAPALERTIKAVVTQFGEMLPAMKWVNFGGGHHISHPDYDRDLLCSLIEDFQQKYQVQVYLEPGEAIALNAGVLVCSVLDIIESDGKIAILDASAACHMPDVLEMPYRPCLRHAGAPDEKAFTYRLGGLSCLAGDIIGDYSFDKPLKIGDRLIFEDMAIYTMVKNTTFNGLRLPSIALYDPESDAVTTVREFGYEDFRARLS